MSTAVARNHLNHRADAAPGGLRHTSPMTTPTGSQVRRELGRRGFPLFLRPRERAETLLSNTAPAYVTLLLVTAVLGYAMHVFEGLSEDQVEHLEQNASTRVLVATTLMFVVPFVCLALLFVLRRLSTRVRSLLCVVVIVLYLGLGLLPGVTAASDTGDRFLLALVLAFAGYIGGGRMFGWAVRRSFRELSSLGPMIARVLPLLVLTMLFFFFNAEIWQVVFHISMDRTWGLVAVIEVACGILAWVVTRDLVQTVVDESARDHPDAPPLRFGERFNVVFNTMLITLVQVVLLSCLVFGFFLAFGALSVPDSTAQAWMGAKPTELHGVWAVLGVNQNLVQVCLVMAAISGLSFLSTATTDATYRATFVEPALREVSDALDMRAHYLTHEPPAPTPLLDELFNESGAAGPSDGSGADAGGGESDLGAGATPAGQSPAAPAPGDENPG